MLKQEALVKPITDSKLRLTETDNKKIHDATLESLFNELIVLVQQVNLTAQAMIENGLVFSNVAQQAVEKTCLQLKDNNIPVLIPINTDIH